MNRLLILIALTVVLLNCKSSAPSLNQSDRSSQAALKGDWKITDITYPGSDYFKVNSFQIAESKCLIGSQWTFVPNNNTGTMSLTRSECPSYNASISWSIDKTGNFGLKFIGTGAKSKNISQGYLLRIDARSETSFRLIDVIKVGSQDKEITYQFEKMN